MNVNPDELFYAFVLTQCELLLPREILLLIEKAGSAKAAFFASELLYQQMGVTPIRYRKLRTLQSNLQQLEKQFLELVSLQIHVLHFDDPQFPQQLKHTAACPYLLFYRGQLPDLNQEQFLAVVGTRHATDYGKKVVAQFIPELCRAGITIVSGLAFGIDAWAHEMSCNFAQKSLAILARGVEQASPQAQQKLFERLCETGCVMSEFAVSTGLHARHFPRRNRIVSGLCAGVLVVEAPEKSGALITAHFALEQNRNVYAVPAGISQKQSEGCLRLIKQGAKLVSETQDILIDYDISSARVRQTMALPLLSSFAEEVLQFCNDTPKHKDEFYLRFNENTSVLSSTLTQLELEGFITQLDGYFVNATGIRTHNFKIFGC